jgi:hypothetical protein
MVVYKDNNINITILGCSSILLVGGARERVVKEKKKNTCGLSYVRNVKNQKGSRAERAYKKHNVISVRLTHNRLIMIAFE